MNTIQQGATAGQANGGPERNPSPGTTNADEFTAPTSALATAQASSVPVASAPVAESEATAGGAAGAPASLSGGVTLSVINEVLTRGKTIRTTGFLGDISR